MEDINIWYSISARRENRQLTEQQKSTLEELNKNLPIDIVIIESGFDSVEVILSGKRNVKIVIESDGTIYGTNIKDFLKHTKELKTAIKKFNSLYAKLEKLDEETPFLIFPRNWK